MTFAQFAQDNLFLFILLIALVIAVVIYELRNRNAGGSVTAIAASRLINDGAYLIDTRSPAEFKAGHIAGAKSHPAENFAKNIARVKAKKSQAVIVCCHSGMTAKTQVQLLREQGYEMVYVLSGGIQGWRDENLPTVKH